MKKRLHLGRGIAILACAASLAGTAAAVAPTAASAAGTSCGDKSIKIKPPEGGRPSFIPVKAVSVEGGATCAEAVKVIAGALLGELPPGWKSVTAKFKAPGGLFPQELKKGSKVVKYAIRGG